MCNVSNYRFSGLIGTPKDDVIPATRLGVAWLTKSMRETGFSHWLARSMKQSTAFLLNSLHNHAENHEMGFASRRDTLLRNVESVIAMETYWHDVVMGIKVSHRCQMDMSMLFYGLPASDCDPSVLFRKASVDIQDPNKADPAFLERLLDYSKAVDFCHAVVRFKGSVKFAVKDGYSFHDDAWYKSCLKGELRLPPKEDWGKVWIYKFFPFTDPTPTWFWSASDVTHVTSEESYYGAPQHTPRS
jgi:hypothetical protein